MTTIPLCFRCRHFRDMPPDRDGHYYCAAFVESPIPDAILFGDHDHHRPYPGDDGVTFEPKPEDEIE